MPILIHAPSTIKAVGNKPKVIEEYIGRINSGTADLSIARMKCLAGWEEPGQTPEFDEYTVIVHGLLRVRTRGETLDVRAGQAVITRRGEWIQYSTPEEPGADYFAICLPAFSPDSVHRDK
jgi:mannose-6-phosphate isomerase-like protein (cupin superfamily)